MKSESASVIEARSFWNKIFHLRTTLACYKHNGGNKELVGLNACLVKNVDDPPSDLSQVRFFCMSTLAAKDVH